jgi:predicted ester cyclase
MSIEENKRILQRYFDELMNNRDYSKADEILHKDYSGSADGGFSGVDGHKQYTRFVHSAFSDLHWETQEMMAEGDRIAIFQKCSGIHDKEFRGIPGTGKRFSYDMVSMYEFKDEKVYRGLARQIYDRLNLFQQWGILPSTAEIINAYKESHSV